MDIIWVISGFFIFILIVFIVITFLFPEVMGITGKKARDIMEHQQGEKPPNDPAP